MRYFISIDPGIYIRKVECPVLAVTGELDSITPPAHLDAIEVEQKTFDAAKRVYLYAVNMQYICIDIRHTINYYYLMTFNWNEEKNNKLKKERGISFEEIILAINDGKVIKVLQNPKKEKYPNQRMYLINYNNYIYVVPYVINEETKEIFLKTVFPSRFYSKEYLSGGNPNEK